MLKPKILVFIDWFHPGYKAGGPVRSNVNMIEHLKEDFHFYIVTRNTDYCEQIPYKGITSNCWTTIKNNVNVWYCSQDKTNIRYFLKILKETSWDKLYINGIYSWSFSILPLILGKLFLKKKIIVAARGMLKDSAVNIKRGRKNLFIQCAKLINLYNNITFHATTNEETIDIRNYLGQTTNVHIAPNLPRKLACTSPQKFVKETGKLIITSIARIAPEKNTLYSLNILKRLNNFNITYNLYGSIYNNSYWEECQNIIEDLSTDVKVTYYGVLDSEQVYKKLETSHFLFLPTQGENFGHVILESLSAGCPVIISNQTPWRNLEQKNIGWDISLKKPEQFVEIIQKCVLMDQQEYNKMRSAAYNYAKSFINDPEVLEANLKLFNS